jgi:hypothetical protein
MPDRGEDVGHVQRGNTAQPAAATKNQNGVDPRNTPSAVFSRNQKLKEI